MTSSMENMTIPSRLKHWAGTHPNKEVFVFFTEGGRTIAMTPMKVFLMAGRFAARLRDVGLRKGDVVSNAMVNCPERVIADLGIIMAGCVVSSVQALEKDGTDLWNLLRHHQSSGLILPVQETNQVYSKLKPDLPPNHEASRAFNAELPNAPSVKTIIMINRADNINGFLESLMEDSSEVFNHSDISSDDLASIFPTSGTSGMSKSVPRTHADVLRIAGVFEGMPATKRYCQNQLGWVGGFPFNFLGNCSCSFIQDCFNGKTKIGVDRIWELMEEEGCTTAFCFPPELQRFIEHFEHKDPPTYRLRAIITGGQPLTKKFASGILEYLSDGVAISYASTEMWAITNHFLRSADHMSDFMAGVPWAGVQVRIVNDKREDLEAEQHGDILVKSPFGVYHYYNQPASKPLHTEDGYYLTGDRGWLDKDGVLYVRDRSDNVIVNGIVSVFPSWPESVLSKMPGVAEVAVIGIPQKDGVLSDVCACIVLQQGSDTTEISLLSSYNEQFTTDENNAFFPKIDRVEFFSSFPRTETGKIKRKQLRQTVLERE